MSSIHTAKPGSNDFLPRTEPVYRTPRGQAICGDSLEVLNEFEDNSINLVMTSPPFALQREKEYGNLDQHAYIDWLTSFARIVYKKLKPDGSFVVDLGGAYQKGVPARSLYNFRIPIKFCDDIGFFLAEDFYWFNPSKLPSPIEWVNKRKIRVKDSINTVWWFSKTEWPKSDVKKVLAPYSDRMKKLLEDPAAFYSAKKRPSGHDISEGFGKDNGGSIPSNLLQIPNSESNGLYFGLCKKLGLSGHPARFPSKLPQFFIKMLTDPDDLVVDIFGGSNTTGRVAETEDRNWVTIEQRMDYLAASAFRFLPDDCPPNKAQEVYDQIINGGKNINLSDWHEQFVLFGLEPQK